MGKLADILLSGYGFLTEDSLKELKKIMGGNFKIVVKTYNYDRFIVTINQLENLRKEVTDDIKEVFVDASTYNSLIKMMGLD